MPLLEKVRIEVFIPDLPDPIYNRLLEELGDELTYAFGGCTVIQTAGKYRSASGLILPDNVNVLFTDTPLTGTTTEQSCNGTQKSCEKSCIARSRKRKPC